MIGVCLELTDCSLHADPIRRGISQIFIGTRGLLTSCIIAAEPRIAQPMAMYMVKLLQPEIGT